MTDLIEQLRKLEGQTTEGPWRIHDCESYGDRCKTFYQEIWNDETDILVTTEVTRAQNDGGTYNMRLIALAPSMAKKLLAAEAVVRAMHDLSEWQSYDSARAVFDPPMPEKYECTNDAKAAMVSALDAYEAL
ncbi:hypothetical protein PVV74_11570 [Roseovarius sp. SK2]|uniref:hypothetical protein n=1 Tax=Roseovarius TaxID=74030 RepID=UPI00237B6A63|nr:hypothetical protein [Roseovarius sp. SK2]MDD9726095.1 hypothetical protein [Roseovarius sp. SK2]